MRHLVTSILAAWREAERQMGEQPDATLAERIHVLQNAYRLATEEHADRDEVVRLLDEHGLSEIVPPPGDGPLGQPA
jgi:hypothetical protein